jgi:hypothetical protein
MIYLTSGSTIKKTAVNLNLNQTLVERTIQRTFDAIQEPLDAFFPGSEADVRCDTVFDNHPNAFGYVDASPIFIRRHRKY